MLSLTGRYQAANASHRIRDSTSGALVGKNIVQGIATSQMIGKSSSSILQKDGGAVERDRDKLNLAKINIMSSDARKKYTTTAHHG